MNNDTHKEKHSWLTGILTGWGIKESWAKIIAGAIIGALIAAGAITSTSCTATGNITPEQVQRGKTVAALLHEAAHAATGTKCRIIPVEECKK